MCHLPTSLRSNGSTAQGTTACRPRHSSSSILYCGARLCRSLPLQEGQPQEAHSLKTYACIYICFSTKTVHLELVSDLTSAAFLASFCRFTGRQGCPAVVYSDNGTNFKGSWGELKQMQDMLASSTTQDLMHHHATEHQITWKFSPSMAPHIGGLWEAGVKSMKTLLRKIASTHRLTYEELSTVLIEVEATLNSLPLLSTDSTPEDGVSPLTPGHFLIGRPLRSSPLPVDTTSNPSNLKRWNLVRRLSTDIWQRWRRDFLQEQQARSKWKKSQPNLQPGLLKELDLGRQPWRDRVVATHPGKDKLTRVVEIFHSGKTYRRPIHKLVLLVPAKDQEDVRA